MSQKLFFLRHLKTANNSQKRINGKSLLQPIEKEEAIIGDCTIDEIWCSDALRCRQTVECFLKDKASVPIIYTELLRERDMGVWEGELRDNMSTLYPEYFHNRKFHVFMTPPSGESYEALKNRVEETIRKLRKRDRNVLICSHNQFLKMAAFMMTGKEISQEKWEAFQFPHGVILSEEDILNSL